MTTDGDNISVVVPVYNGGLFISGALESILAQTLQPGEIIVIDDGSTDDTADIVMSFGDQVRYQYQANSGSSVARNHGVQISSGELLAFLDADDLWSKDKLATQSAVLQQNPTLDLIWGHVVEFAGLKPLSANSQRPVPGHHPGAMLIRRQAFNRIGEFSEFYQQAEVVEWMTRVLDSGVNQAMLPDVLMYRRIHAANKGRSNAEAGSQYLQILKRHLDRKRTQ